MSDQKYDSTVDVEQSGIRFVSQEPADAAIDWNCERLCYAIESLCNGRKIVGENEEGDRLDPFFDSDDFPQQFIDLIYENKSDIFNKKSRTIVIEFIFSCAFSVLFENTDTFNTNIDQISQILCTQSDAFSKINIKLLCLLFNLIPSDNKFRFVVMQRLLDLGKRIKTILAQKLFRGQLSCLSEWIETDWKPYLTLTDKKKLYQTASFVAKKAAEKEIYLKYLICYLKLFDFDDENESKQNDAFDMKSVVDEAAQAIIAAISCDEFNSKNVMELIHSNVICNIMSKTPKYKELYNLLKIVYQGNVNDFEIFYKQNTKKMTQLGLIYKHLQNKMRLLTLCTLGSTQNTSYSFQQLMNILQLNSQNQLEELVIIAITKKLLYAKIDYATNQIDITKSKQRIFDKNSWNDLAKKLFVWKQNTNTILQIVHRQQYMQEMTKQLKQAKNQ